MIEVNQIISRSLVAKFVSRAVIPGRNPITFFGPTKDDGQPSNEFIGIVDQLGKTFKIIQNNATKSFEILTEAPCDAHKLIIFSLCGVEMSVFSGDYEGKIKKWSINLTEKSVNLDGEIDVCPGICINCMVATNPNTVFVGGSDGILRKVTF